MAGTSRAVFPLRQLTQLPCPVLSVPYTKNGSCSSVSCCGVVVCGIVVLLRALFNSAYNIYYTLCFVKQDSDVPLTRDDHNDIVISRILYIIRSVLSMAGRSYIRPLPASNGSGGERVRPPAPATAPG